MIHSRMKFLLPVLLACAAAPLLNAQSANPAPDAIYFNGHILTGEGLVFEPFTTEKHLGTDKPHFVTALVVSQGKIARCHQRSRRAADGRAIHPEDRPRRSLRHARL